MKYVRITISKNRFINKTEFIYPDIYNKYKFNVAYYQNEGLDQEFAIASTDDNFIESDGLKEITLVEAKNAISDYVTNDKDLDDNSFIIPGKTITDFIKQRQDLLGE